MVLAAVVVVVVIFRIKVEREQHVVDDAGARVAGQRQIVKVGVVRVGDALVPVVEAALDAVNVGDIAVVTVEPEAVAGHARIVKDVVWMDRRPHGEPLAGAQPRPAGGLAGRRARRRWAGIAGVRWVGPPGLHCWSTTNAGDIDAALATS